MTQQPTRVVHADWSASPQKRWAACATLQTDGRYRLEAPELVTPDELLTFARAGRTFIGFDFPIGVPYAYAQAAQVESFLDLLPRLGQGRWSSFFDVAMTAEQISVTRPFYPARPGGAKRQHLVDRLHLSSTDHLYRCCDVASGRRACPMFWTLGGNQVGKAALSGWREFLQPAIAMQAVRLWPFHGGCDELLCGTETVVAETYPGALYTVVGAALPVVNGKRGKRSKASRAASASGILAWAREQAIEISAELGRELLEGFGERQTGEDRFDAVVGALGMLAVVRGALDAGAACTETVQRAEGWILGRARSRDTCESERLAARLTHPSLTWPCGP